MPVVFTNEYNKYQNKIGKGLFSSFQDVIKPSVEIFSNIKDIKALNHYFIR